MRPALVLNASYEPLTVVSWKKGLTLVLLGKAETLSPQPSVVRAASQCFELPSVLRLFQRVRLPCHAVQFCRSNVYRRDAWRCQYCLRRFSPCELTFDHVLPRSRGGQTTWQNIVTSCQPCNRRKGDRTPLEAGMPLRCTPLEPRWWPFSSGSGMIDDHPEEWRPYLWT